MKVQETDIPIPPGEDPLQPGEDPLPPEEDPIPPEDADENDKLDYNADSAWKTVHRLFGLGYDRKQQLDDMDAVKQRESGEYCIDNAHTGDYADFHSTANFNYLKEKYTFLHGLGGNQLGIDDDAAIDAEGSLENYLGKIPEDDWEAFKEDMERLENYPLLDEEGASELEMEESSRWVTEDGGPDLINAMRDGADDTYEGYLLGKVTIDLIFEWMRETEHYPEAQGDGSVWMRMEELGEERKTQEWFLEHIEDDLPGWLAIKRQTFDTPIGAALSDDSVDLEGIDPHGSTVGQVFDQMLRSLASTDEEIAHTYNRIDQEILWKMFLAAFPDERIDDGDPYWYFWKQAYNEPGTWRVGFQAAKDQRDVAWKRGYLQALEYLKTSPWFLRKIKAWFRQPPEVYPEFKFEALDQTGVGDVDPDDPATFMRHGGGLEEDLVYEDDKIVVMSPRNMEALNYHLRLSGIREIEKKNWDDLFKYRDVYVVLAKQPVDMLGHTAKRELGIIWGNDDEELKVFNNAINPPTLDQLMSTPDYGKSVRRMLLSIYRERVQSDDKAGRVLLQLGGPAELRRAERLGHLSTGAYRVSLGLHYVKRHKYALAAKSFGRVVSTVLPEGVWLIFDAVEDLVPVFKNREAAKTVFASDHYDWVNFDLPDDVSDVFPFLDKRAIDHIREVMVNRSVWFPDAGPDQQGDYVVLTSKILSEYTDKEILDWLDRPSDEDQESEVFADIIEAIKRCGARIIETASLDSIYTGYIEAAVDAIDGKEHKWTTHPSKKGDDAFSVFVKWSFVADWAQEHFNNQGQAYDGALEDLALEVKHETADPDSSNMGADWRDVNKDFAKEQLDEIYELTAPDPPGHDPNQTLLPLPESEEEDLDKPAAMPKALSGIPVDFEKRVTAELKDIAEHHGMAVENVEFELSWVSDIHSKLVVSVCLGHEPDLEHLSEEWRIWIFALRKIRGWVKTFFPDRLEGDGIFVDSKGKAFFYSGSKKLSLDNCVRFLYTLAWDSWPYDSDVNNAAAQGPVIHGVVQPGRPA